MSHMNITVKNQQPSVGRIVHYQTFGTPLGEHPSEPIAALITAVHDPECVDLCAFYPNGLSFKQRVFRSSGPAAGCWNWPPSV